MRDRLLQGLSSVKNSIVNLGSSIGSSLSDLGNSLLDSLSDLGEFITTTFSNVGETIVNGLSAIGDLFNTVGNFLADTFNTVGNLLLDGLSTLGNFIVTGLQNVLEFLFVPSENLFSEVQTLFNEKFGIFSQVSELVNSLTFTDDDDMPEFNITLYGKKMKFFDFSMFGQYRSFIHNIILMVAYFKFVIWLVNNAPAIVTGTGGSLSDKGGNDE